MRGDSDRRGRRSIRLPGYDYSRPGFYAVTICTQNRECLFGEIGDGIMQANAAGQMILKWWQELPVKFPSIATDEFGLMPNHIHGIIRIRDSDRHGVGANPRVCPDSPGVRADPPAQGLADVLPFSHNSENVGYEKGGQTKDRHTMGGHAWGRHVGLPLPLILQWFKTMTTNEYIRNVRTIDWRPFQRRLWQRNYYEHIIRNEKELENIRKYIRENPLRWTVDEYFTGG